MSDQPAADGPASPSFPAVPEGTVQLTTDEQLRAVNNVVRHRILGVLRDGPATITQVAQKLELAKGSSSYHLRLLERAGLVEVVRTNKVRGVTERYYGRTSRGIELPDPAPGEPDIVMRHAIADLEAAPPGPRFVGLTHVRISEERFEEFTERFAALISELRAAADPEAPTANLALAFYRPQDTK
ncbi:winged helix-turn-helix domain-containing protein [Kitasatospora sp. NBC_01287]|uniref:ArsR/SmtB family transcription factor n=1 Tax=Kitasatospora sp. NBC_01287 TaxID=2903573 RepID=UPI0022538FAE|nr:winged helix-turn-helix domain-containing protein [Kitasatospora sp. NBC_01287]MCX4746823.1 winged helix-turn-helix domain-containing protein [Kitasatospora sp. NBC_01287]